MSTRQIIVIDEDLCDGCGQCVPACDEGAIQVIDGKARLVSEVYCDGLGACLGECPQNALTIEQREVQEFDPRAVQEHLEELGRLSHRQDPPPEAHNEHPGVCPGSAIRDLRPGPGKLHAGGADAPDRPSRLMNWPVQIKLVPVQAPWLAGADLLIAADCVPFALPDFHEKILQGKILLVGCPKLDDANFYRQKLTAIFQMQDVRSVEVAIMEVPCCGGMTQLVEQALDQAGKQIPLTVRVFGIRGEKLTTSRPRSVTSAAMEDRA